MRLIDADELKLDCDIYDSWDAKIVKAWLDDQPTIDAEPVVRCKDCKYSHMTLDGLCKYCGKLAAEGLDDAVYFEGTHFCSDGAKMDEVTE